jgi:hypothetical protein
MKALSPNSSVKELVAFYDLATAELEEARLAAEAAWAVYETKAAAMVKLNNRWGIAIRRYKELGEDMPIAGKTSWWSRLWP